MAIQQTLHPGFMSIIYPYSFMISISVRFTPETFSNEIEYNKIRVGV